jgi:predicted nucleic acid-binding protein
LALFVDTSALYALLDRDDQLHHEALILARSLEEAELVTHNYVVVETTVLVQSRLTATHVRRLLRDLLPPIAIEWVSPETHTSAVSALLAPSRPKVPFVDLVSFAFMRRALLDTAFTFDRDFGRAGFHTVP